MGEPAGDAALLPHRRGPAHLFVGVGAYTFTHFGGETWAKGRTATWNANTAGSTDNSFEITFDTTGGRDWTVRLSYRLNGLALAGVPLAGFSAFEYRVGPGPFAPVPGADLTLVGDATNRTWAADLAEAAIEDAGPVTLRWTFSDYDQAASAQVRFDDLQVTGRRGEDPPPPPPPPPDRDRLLPTGHYNVLFIPVDDLRPLLGAYGAEEPLRPRTPHLDRLARTGVIFTNAHCQQAVCNASRVTVLTGLRPDSTRAWKLETHFRTVLPDIVTLPQHFGAQGYRTHGIAKIFHNTNPTWQDDPTSWTDGWASSSTGHVWYEEDKAAAEDAGNGKVSATDAGVVDRAGQPITDAAYGDGRATDLALAKLASYAAGYHATGQRFFLAVGFQKPHLPFNCPRAYWDLYDPAAIDLTGYDGAQTMPTGTNSFAAPFGGEPAAFDDVAGHPVSGMPTEPEARHLIHGYLACVSFIDAQVGRLLDALEDPDGDPGTADSIAGETIVVLWGDHGFHLGDHNGFWAKHSNFETATRVPLLVRAPGMAELGAAGRMCTAPVELVDLYPTLLDLCSLAPPAQPPGLGLQGTSFLPLLEDPAQPWKRAAFSQFTRNINGPGVTNPGNGMGYSIRTARHRYTEWWRTVSSDGTADLHVPVGTAPQHVELYDHEVDPGETVNLAGDPAHAAVQAELAALLHDGDPALVGDGWKLPAVDAPAEVPGDYGTWRERHATPGQAPDTLDPERDPDGDGMRNLLEYKLGTHPLEPDRPPVAVTAEPGGVLRIAFPEVAARTDATVAVATAPGLAAATWSGAGIAPGPDAGARGLATVRTATLAAPAAGASAFVRVEVEETGG